MLAFTQLSKIVKFFNGGVLFREPVIEKNAYHREPATTLSSGPSSSFCILHFEFVIGVRWRSPLLLELQHADGAFAGGDGLGEYLYFPATGGRPCFEFFSAGSSRFAD